jgi:HD superfamily phosphohydrolase
LTLSEIQKLADEFAERQLSEYVSDIERHHRQFSRKEINDSLWGTVNLTPIEVALLDSPLLQRLRSIRQLGVVHWVYPGAGHTRFEHTIGVLRQVQNLVTALNVLGVQHSISPLIDLHFTQLLRLSALLHDTGHAAFSHVSELALESLPEISTLSFHFSQAHKVEGRQLSEIFVFYVIRSPAVRSFFNTMLDVEANFILFSRERQENLDLIIERLSNSVIGKKIDDRIPLLHEIISGPFDADKLDYFVRDARQAGTPSVLDISRLIQKISMRPLDKHDLPDEIAKNVNEITGAYWIFGIRWSGVAVLDELHLARVLLFAKIYRHPKVIVIEQMLKAVLVNLATLVEPKDLLRFVYEYDDDQLLAMTPSLLKDALGLSDETTTAEQHDRIRIAGQTLSDIKLRRLSVKAFQIQNRYPFDPLEKDSAQEEGLIDFGTEVSHPQESEGFKKKLYDQVALIQEHLGAPAPLSAVEIETSVTLRMTGQTPGATQIARAYLLPTTGQPMPFRKYMVNRAAWAAGYMTDQPAGYIFAPDRIADAVYLAVEKLLRVEYNVRLPDSALEASKRNFSSIQVLKKRLAKAGYYRDAPFDIRPAPDRLRKVDVQAVVERFASRATIFQEPQNLQSSAVRQLNLRERTTAWLRQFDNDEHVDCAIRLLECFKFIGRSDTVAAVRTFIDRNPSFRGATVIPFGEARDSGSIQTYFSADLIGTYVGACETLETAAKKSLSSPIIIVDDFVASGGQGKDILAAGFGLNSLRPQLGETRDLFDGDIQSFLRKAKISFVFTAAWDSGVSTIESMAHEVGLDATVYRHIGEAEIPFAFENCLQDVEPSIIASFKQACQEIGTSLIQSSQPVPDAAKAATRSLGYGNRAMLLASAFNVPTQTLTCFWADGNRDGVPWSPLLPRRKKQ